MDKKTVANEWFNIAKIDLNSAKYLCDMHPLPKEIICYHCQQAAEKMLKGFIALNGGELFKTHDLVILNKECIKFNPGFNDLVDICIDLVDYGVNIRYPYHIEITDEDVKIAISNSEKLMNFIYDQLSL